MKEADLAEHVDGGLALGGSVNLLHGAPEHWPVEGYPKEEQSPYPPQCLFQRSQQVIRGCQDNTSLPSRSG